MLAIPIQCCARINAFVHGTISLWAMLSKGGRAIRTFLLLERHTDLQTLNLPEIQIRLSNSFTSSSAFFFFESTSAAHLHPAVLVRPLLLPLFYKLYKSILGLTLITLTSCLLRLLLAIRGKLKESTILVTPTRSLVFDSTNKRPLICHFPEVNTNQATSTYS